MEAGKLLCETGLMTSMSEAKRLIEQGSVEVNGERISSRISLLTLKDGMIIKIGKTKFVRVRVNPCPQTA